MDIKQNQYNQCSCQNQQHNPKNSCKDISSLKLSDEAIEENVENRISDTLDASCILNHEYFKADYGKFMIDKFIFLCYCVLVVVIHTIHAIHHTTHHTTHICRDRQEVKWLLFTWMGLNTYSIRFSGLLQRLPAYSNVNCSIYLNHKIISFL